MATSEIVRRAIEEVRRVCEEPPAAALTHGEPRAPLEWPPGSLNAARRFGLPLAKLYPFIGRKVRTPEGPGTLLQVFSGRATVLLDSDRDSTCRFFAPEEIEPFSMELP